MKNAMLTNETQALATMKSVQTGGIIISFPATPGAISNMNGTSPFQFLLFFFSFSLNSLN